MRPAEYDAMDRVEDTHSLDHTVQKVGEVTPGRGFIQFQHSALQAHYATDPAFRARPTLSVALPRGPAGCPLGDRCAPPPLRDPPCNFGTTAPYFRANSLS